MFQRMPENTACRETRDHLSFEPLMNFASTKAALQALPIAHMVMAFLLICANKLGVDVSGGEEQYLAFARQFINPDWIPGSFTLTEFAGSRIVFQWLVGPVMELMPFEQAVFFFRLVNFLLIGIPIGLFFHRLGFSLPLSFLTLQIFLMSDQNLVGGEWILKTFEPKSVAYIFVFFALYYFLDKRQGLVAVHLALASYFHILVGGWLLGVLVLIFFLEGFWKKSVQLGVFYALLMAPMIAYLLPGYFGQTVPETDFNLDWVYAYHRLPHHLGLWKTTEYFMKGHFWGVVQTVGLFAIGIVWRKWLPENLRRLNAIMLLCFIINLLFVGVAAIDHFLLENSGGLGLKFYPFRTNSIGMLLGMVILMGLLWQKMEIWSQGKRLRYLLLGSFTVLAVAQLVNNIERSKKHLATDPDFREMCAFISSHTDREDVFFILHPYWGHRDYNSFTRRAERENFYVPKFVSAERIKLVEWYERYQFYMQLRSKLDFLPEGHERYGITYMLTNDDREDPNIELAHEVGQYRLYKLTL